MKNSFGYCQLANNFHQENKLNIKKNRNLKKRANRTRKSSILLEFLFNSTFLQYEHFGNKSSFNN